MKLEIRGTTNKYARFETPDVLQVTQMFHNICTLNAQTFGFDVSEHDIELGRSFCQNFSKTRCPEKMLKFGLIVMAENNFKDPSSAKVP